MPVRSCKASVILNPPAKLHASMCGVFRHKSSQINIGSVRNYFMALAFLRQKSKSKTFIQKYILIIVGLRPGGRMYWKTWVMEEFTSCACRLLKKRGHGGSRNTCGLPKTQGKRASLLCARRFATHSNLAELAEPPSTGYCRLRKGAAPWLDHVVSERRLGSRRSLLKNQEPAGPACGN